MAIIRAYIVEYERQCEHSANYNNYSSCGTAKFHRRDSVSDSDVNHGRHKQWRFVDRVESQRLRFVCEDESDEDDRARSQFVVRGIGGVVP